MGADDDSAARTEQLNSFLSQYRIVKAVQEKVDAPAWVIALGEFAVFALIYNQFFGLTNLVQLVAWLGPAYGSLLALEADDDAELARWLKYWVVYGLVFATEAVIELFTTARSGVSLPTLLKVGVQLVLLMPQTNGAVRLFDGVLAPAFRSNRAHIDSALHTVRTRAEHGAQELGAAAIGLAAQGYQHLQSASGSGGGGAGDSRRSSGSGRSGR